jgi:hypothetical protein
MGVPVAPGVPIAVIVVPNGTEVAEMCCLGTRSTADNTVAVVEFLTVVSVVVAAALGRGHKNTAETAFDLCAC